MIITMAIRIHIIALIITITILIIIIAIRHGDEGRTHSHAW